MAYTAMVTRNEEMEITSLEVAEMVEKDHNKLLRDIRNYIEQFNQSKIGHVDFFSESTYTDSKGETRPCYLVTKKGCEFIAHKLTGVKGTAFTARYINRFHEMEDELKRQQEEEQRKRVKSVIKEQKQLTGTVKIPKISKKRLSLQDKIERIAGRQETTFRKITGEIMYKLGRMNNLEVAKRLYYKKYGFMPPYALDLIEFSPELTNKAHKIADQMLMKPTKYEVRRAEQEKIFESWGG